MPQEQRDLGYHVEQKPYVLRYQGNEELVLRLIQEADVFANPTREEVLGMVNLEALACGTPVITFRTGGSPECIDETCGSVVDCDEDTLEKEIVRVCESRPYLEENCIKRAEMFDKTERFEEYLQLFVDL